MLILNLKNLWPAENVLESIVDLKDNDGECVLTGQGQKGQEGRVNEVNEAIHEPDTAVSQSEQPHLCVK